jgi:hypothetical protein
MAGATIGTLTGVSISNADPSVLTLDATIDDGLAVGDVCIVNSGTNATAGVYVVKSMVANTSVTLDRQAATGACTDGSITYINGEGLTVTSLGAMHLSDGTGASIIRQYAEPGLGSRTTIGLDETARTLLICDAGDVDKDFGESAVGSPALFVYNADGDTRSFLSSSTINLSNGWLSMAGSTRTINVYAGVLTLATTTDRSSGNAFDFKSSANVEFTDTDGEQSWVYIEPKINQSGTAAYNGLKVNALETTPGTSIGDGSTGDGNLLLNLQRESVTHFKVDRTGAYGTMASTGGLMTYYSEAVGTATAAATFDIEVNIPSGAKIIGVQLRVDTALSSSDGGTTWSAAYIDGSTASVASGKEFAQNTKQDTFFDAHAATDITSAETDITVTADGGKTFIAGGVVRAIVYYQTFTAMGDAS